ncbi:PREDICTED: odorant receptor Or1-like [Ceratosolen solmsi marchali]|uniref:Odorant receptor n=1 Tax=Ceratosolen solmsi marchali TaxID=326594 RepID=A0AAJ6YSG2_9HYME|nr:PREDICTED: odorant receptor Or1-like [Ceratosolen solmsi marchali]
MSRAKRAAIVMNENIAPIPFRILKFCGLWRPVTWSSWKKRAYCSFTALVLFMLISMMMAVFIRVCEMPMTEDVFAENIFLMFALINAIFKAINLLISRGRFIKLLNMIQNKRWQNLRNAQEIEIREKYNKTIRKISIYFTSAVSIAIVLRLTSPLFEPNDEIKLPVESYCPCDISNAGCYWAIYWHQAIGTGIATLTHASKDSLISALLLKTCFQLEILKNRLLSIPKLCASAKRSDDDEDASARIPSLESRLITECVRDHESIFKFANLLNDTLNVLLFGQLAVTLPNLCLSVYLMSKQSIGGMEFMMTFQFFMAVVIELYFFCWYGNEVTLNSLEVENAVHEMDWTSLSIKSRKELLFIMKRTSKPILFSVGPIMNMNIDSFLSIMKTSYSAFSVLQSTDS